MSEIHSTEGHDEEALCSSQPFSIPSSASSTPEKNCQETKRPPKYKGQRGQFRSIEEIDAKYRHVFTYPYFNLVQSSVIDDALYSNKSMVVCAPTGSGKTVIFEMAILQLLMDLEDKNNTDDFKIIYMAPVKALCTERITEWYSKFTKLGLLCIEVTGDTDVDFSQLQPYRIIITTPEKWDMLTRRWMEYNMVKVVKLFLIDEVHILNDEMRGPVLEAVVSRMKTVESSVRSNTRLVAVSATISNPEDVAAWLAAGSTPAVHYKFGDECRPVKLTRIVEGYQCSSGTSIFKFDIILNYKLWPIIQKYYNGKPTLIFCNTRKSVMLTAETLSREITVGFSMEQRGKLTALASTIKNKKIQSLVLSGVGCHHAGLLFEERVNIEQAFRNRDLPILITTTTLAMGVNLPAHLVIIKNTQQYVNGAYQEYSRSTVLQMAGRAGRPQYDRAAAVVIMTRAQDKARYQSLVGGSEPLQSFLHKRLAENINSEIALGTIGDVAQCVQWLNSTFLRVRAAKDPKRYLGLSPTAPAHLITKKIEELCVGALNGLESSGLVTMDELSCIESTEAGRLMSLHYLDLETMKLIMKIEGTETLERLLWLVCESHELSDMHLRVDERRCLNALNRNNSAPTIRYQMKGKINSRQMKLNCVIQSVLGCLPIPDPSLNQEALKIMRTADRVCKCLVSYVTRPNLISQSPKFYAAILNSLLLAKCITAHLWENSVFVSRQLKGIGPTFSTLLASAGKTNFMLLDESHPRDLERIMNKGPPAGNVLRKQISLLPKYNLTITPINDQSIRVQLSLLNQSYLSENIDSLTAGARHKSYIVVGDSENFLLYLTSFQDSDLINIYDGRMNFEVSRKHLHEHKVFVHCVSSSFVGIDEQCEHLFKDTNPFPSSVEKTSINKTAQKNSPNRQTFITDVFKERKRKNIDNESSFFKEKKKRESHLIDKFKTLNKFASTSKDREKCNETIVKPVADNLVNAKQYDTTPKDDSIFKEINYEIDESDFLDDFECDIDNERINNLLNEIEGEVNNPSSKNNLNSLKVSDQSDCNVNNSKTLKRDKDINTKNNYTFIERLEKKNVEYDNDNLTSNKETEFSNTIKCNLQQYLQKATNNIKRPVMDPIELHEKYIDTHNLGISSETKEIVNYNANPQIIDLTQSIEEPNTTQTDIPKDNININDIININYDALHYNTLENPDKCVESPKTKKMSLVLENNDDSSTLIGNNKFDSNEEYSLTSYIPQAISPRPMNNISKLEPLKTLKNTDDLIVESFNDSCNNFNETRVFSVDYASKPESASPTSMNTKDLKSFQKSINVFNTIVQEKSDNFCSLFSKENNSDTEIQHRNMNTKFKDIKKYSFNAMKTIGVRNENISKICTLKVALDVTEIVHHEDNCDPQNDGSNDNSVNLNKPCNVMSNVDNTEDTVLPIENNIKYLKSSETTNNENITSNQQLLKPKSEISDKPSVKTKLEEKETTLRDILNRFNDNATKQNLNIKEKEFENYSAQSTKNANYPKIKHKRKYRISDLDTIDITLPESLVPRRSQVNNKKPVIHKINLRKDQNQTNTEEKPIIPFTVIGSTEALDSNITRDTDIDETENDYDTEPPTDFDSYLDDPVLPSTFDLNPAVLNPKTILQSLNNEEIIPPPPEFCDISSQIFDTYIDPDASNANDLSCEDLQQTDAQTDDHSGTMTEIDTNTVYNIRTHRNPVADKSHLLKSRLYNLSQFKFKRKNMLRK